jgi:Spo0E like sporulation regulatory protein
MLVDRNRDSFFFTTGKEEPLMIEKNIQERIRLLREELYRISNQLNYELTHPKLVTISQQLDQLLNQYSKFEQKV